MLRGAGVRFEAMAAYVDEAALKAASLAAPEGLAMELALAKAAAISALHPRALVVGADQILVCEGKSYDKPVNVAAAAAQLRALRGRAHRLVTACCVVRAGAVLWREVAAPELRMRAFSDGFLDEYVAAEAESLCSSVGAYRLEGLGIQLFEAVDGDYFTILGMPLLALLGFLRAAAALAI